MKKFKPNYSFADLWKQFVMFTKNWRRKSTGELVNKDTLELGDVTANDIEANDIDVRDVTCRKVTATGKIKTTGDVEGSKFKGDTALETIKDRDGHLRFVEGDITMNTITGITQTYGKWSLSGTHLMITIAFTISSGTSFGTSMLAIINDIPSWVMDKIVPSGDTEKQVAVKYADEWIDTNAPQTQHLYCGVQKVDNTTLQLARWGGSVTFSADTFFRLQFDLIIDNAESE